MQIFLLFILFFLSGAVSLIYQVLWLRMLCLIFGSTVFATSTVLTSFMAGLSVGSFMGGRWIDEKSKVKSKNLVLLYGVIELLIGIYAFFTPHLFDLVKILYLKIYPIYSASFYTLSLWRFSIIFLILLLPTTLMGATLPILSKYLVKSMETLGKKVGTLYSINTWGATSGVLISSFYLLPKLGIKDSLYFAVIINILIFILIISLFKIFPILITKREKFDIIEKNKVLPSKHILFILFAFFLSGFCALSYEVLWTRALSLMLGITVYAFSIMLLTFLLGIALGSYIISIFINKIKNLIFTFGLFEVLIGIFCIVSIVLYQKLSFFLFLNFEKIKNSFLSFQIIEFFLAGMITLPLTLLFGAIFPVVIKIYTNDLNKVGTEVGIVYAVNTLGCILGAFLSGFLFMPYLGLYKTIVAITFINLGMGILLVLVSQSEKKNLVYFLVSLGILGFILGSLLPEWNKRVILSGPYLKVKDFKYSDFKEYPREKEIKYYKDGLNATVGIGVDKKEKNLYLVINGKVNASNTIEDMYTQLLSAHIPLLIHKNPKEVLVIGLGSGITAGAASVHPVREVEVVEIEKGVIEAAKYFKVFNRNCLKNKKVKIILDDARNYISAVNKRYDIIISEPSPFWIRGSASLLSKEFLEDIKNRLNKDGIFVQWLHLYQISKEDMLCAIRTINSVFPYISIWHTATADILVLGSKEKININPGLIDKRIKENKEIIHDLSLLQFKDIYTFLKTCYLLNNEEWKRIDKGKGGIINTDDKPYLEFSTPFSLYDNRSALRNRELLLSYKEGEPHFLKNLNIPYKEEEIYYRLGIAYFYKLRWKEAKENFNKAIKISPKYKEKINKLRFQR